MLSLKETVWKQTMVEKVMTLEQLIEKVYKIIVYGTMPLIISKTVLQPQGLPGQGLNKCIFELK